MLIKILTIFLTPLAKALSSLLLSGIKEANAKRDIDELRKEKQKLIDVQNVH